MSGETPGAVDLPSCSVIVCTRYRSAALGRCLDSLAAMDHPDHEVIVVDNTPGDPETERTAARAGAKYVVQPSVGLSRARNAGALAARGELLAFIDDDAIAVTDWLGRHASALAEPTLAATTGRITSIDDGSGRFDQHDLGEAPIEVSRADPYWFELTNFGGVGFGGNMVLRRALFDHGFRFQEQLGAGAGIGAYEEAYAFYEIVRDGGRIAYLPDAIVRHEDLRRPAIAKSRDIWGARDYGAFITLLLFDEPQFRGRTASYIAKALRLAPRPWRRPEPGPRTVSRARMLLAACRGSLLYLRTRLASN